MHSFGSMHVTYRSHTHTHTFANCTYVHIQHARTDTCICPRVCEHDDTLRTALYSPRRRGSGTQMFELFTLNLPDDMREANARGKIQNGECKTARWSRPEKAGWKWAYQGRGVRRELRCAAVSIDWKSGRAFVISQIVRHVIFRFRSVWTSIRNFHFVNRLYIHPILYSLFSFCLSI